MRIFLVSLAAIGLAAATIVEKTKEMTAMPGYFPMYYDAQKRSAVEQSFAQSVIRGLTVEAEDGEHVVIDARPFFLRDAHSIPETWRMKSKAAIRPMTNASSSDHEHT